MSTPVGRLGSYFGGGNASRAESVKRQSCRVLHDSKEGDEAASKLALALQSLPIVKPDEIDAAFQAAQRASAHLVSGNYFSVLGVTAMRGRVLTPEDDAPNAPPAAVISNRYWQQQLNSDPTIVGKTLILNGTNFTVVGLTSPEFFGERVRRSPDFWLPLSFHPQIELRKSYLDDVEAYWLMLMGRLKRDVRIEQAQANTNLALRQFLTEQAGSQLNEDRQRRIQNTSVQLVPGGGGISGLRSVYSKPLHMLMAIVGMVLLVACANVGSLLLSMKSVSEKGNHYGWNT